jgi:deoxyribonuclease (pyrimidine dimer)
MVPASLKRSKRTKTTNEILKSIPKNFTLNQGHVKFFYDKMLFLHRRFHALCDEMEARGYKCERTRGHAFLPFLPEFNWDWEASEEDNNIVRERIALRISQKPHLYT